MKQFSLEEYLKNPDRKVVTKSGDEATIIYTKANKEWPVVAMINSSINPGFVWQFSVDGESMPDNDGSVYYGGIFFADEEEELTEFEKAIKDMGHSVMFMTTECIKQKAKELLDIAFAEFKEREALHMIGEAKEEGRLEVLRYLPKWKKADRDLDAGTIDFAVFHKNDGGDYEDWFSVEVTNRLYKGEYYIELSDLDKLPKVE